MGLRKASQELKTFISGLFRETTETAGLHLEPIFL